ncbi:MAG: hypothetical protein AAF975_02400, partial [Spirochaetota bacterium]
MNKQLSVYVQKDMTTTQKQAAAFLNKWFGGVEIAKSLDKSKLERQQRTHRHQDGSTHTQGHWVKKQQGTKQSKYPYEGQVKFHEGKLSHYDKQEGWIPFPQEVLDAIPVIEVPNLPEHFRPKKMSLGKFKAHLIKKFDGQRFRNIHTQANILCEVDGLGHMGYSISFKDSTAKRAAGNQINSL